MFNFYQDQADFLLVLCGVNKFSKKLNTLQKFTHIFFQVDEYLQRAKDKHGYNMEQVKTWQKTLKKTPLDRSQEMQQIPFLRT